MKQTRANRSKWLEPVRAKLGMRLFCFLGCWMVLSNCNFPGVRPPRESLDARNIRRTLEAVSTPLQTTPSAQPSLEPPVQSIATRFFGLSTATAIDQPPLETVITQDQNPDLFLYFSQPGDTLLAIARRFNVETESITSSVSLPAKGLIPAGTKLTIPNRVGAPPYQSAALPDVEVINSPTALDFDLSGFTNSSGGLFRHYSETVQKTRMTGIEIVERVALESSVNPRLLIALLEMRSGWVLGSISTTSKYPIGFRVSGWEGLYKELVMTATHLNAGYYGWRDGTLTELQFSNGKKVRLDPRLNAGTVAVQHLLSKLYRQEAWEMALYGPNGLLAIYQSLFGDPWERASSLGPLFPDGLTQPTLELPFRPGERWSLTGGPHPSWKTGSPRGAIDLAPVTGEKACSISARWVTAPASGVVARSARNVVALDLDGDGNEQTGWVLIFMHIADFERIHEGAYVEADARIGHPSCEGGTSTGTHFHIARKFNGEWLFADGGIPMVLGGWQVFSGEKNYQGGMMRGADQVVASPVGPRSSIIMRKGELT